MIVNVPPADDEQVAHVFKNRKTGRDVHNLCVVAQQWGVKHSILSQESPLTAVVPKPSEQRSSATMRTKAKEVLISQTCNSAYKGTDLSDLSLNRWLDDMAIQQGVNIGFMSSHGYRCSHRHRRFVHNHDMAMLRYLTYDNS